MLCPRRKLEAYAEQRIRALQCQATNPKQPSSYFCLTRNDHDSSEARPTKPRCLSIDLEVGIKTSIIHQLAALRGDTDAELSFPPGKLPEALNQFDALADAPQPFCSAAI